MNKVVNGKMYNTQTAKLVCEWDNGRYGTDLGAYHEHLYLKTTGEYFLHGGGGPMSKYASYDGGNTCGGQEIIPLTPEEAREFVAEHFSGDKYVEIFGEVEE